MSRSIFPAALLSCSALASPAFAEVTPQEVWADFQSYMQSFGYTVSGTEEITGGDLRVSGVAMSVPLPEDEGEFGIEMSEILFRDAGDKVDVVFPEVMPMRFSVDPQGGEAADGVVEYRHTGLTMQVGEIDGGLEYTYSADQLVLALAELVVDGTPIGRDLARFDFTFDNVSGATSMILGDARAYDQSFDVAALGYDMFFKEDGGPQTLVQFAGKLERVQLLSKASLPKDMGSVDMAKMMAAGLAGDFTMTHQGGQSSMNVTEDGEITAFSATSQSGDLTVGLTDTSVAYATKANGVEMQIAGAELPFPVALKAAQASANLNAPVSRTDSAEDFAFGFTFGDFEMSDMIWNLFDPAKALPRDPATLAVDLSGKAKMLFDVFDPEQASAMENADMPAELESLALNALTLDAAGAKLTGDGAFTFDNADLESFDGFPRPEGEINLQLTGANKLIDTLVSMGLLPEEQAMGARMMMAMFAKPEGDDQLSSKIEINDKGHILANGQRIQ